jgi:hypothetical protein
MEALRFSETSVLRRVTRRHIPEGGILRSHRGENLNLKSYTVESWFVEPLKFESKDSDSL